MKIAVYHQGRNLSDMSNKLDNGEVRIRMDCYESHINYADSFSEITAKGTDDDR